MNTLAIDTSGTDLGVALRTTDDRLYVAIQRAGLRHGETLAPAIAALLAPTGIQARELGLVVVTLGPGSFTGVRIGISTAIGLSMGAGCPVVGVSSLDALARRFSFYHGVVLPVADAKKGRLYAAFYRDGRRTGAHMDVEPRRLAELVADSGERHLLTGPHAAAFRRQLEALLPPGSGKTDLDPLPTATDPVALLELGIERLQREGPTQPLEPLYLRPSEAELKGRQYG